MMRVISSRMMRVVAAQNSSNGECRLTGVSELTVMPVGPSSPAIAINVTPVVQFRMQSGSISIRICCSAPANCQAGRGRINKPSWARTGGRYPRVG
jgi:hypothetical protein